MRTRRRWTGSPSPRRSWALPTRVSLSCVTDQPILVIGSGVIGLTTAICLSEAGHPVRVVAAEPPQRTTSRVAGALWGASFMAPLDEVPQWLEVSREELRALARDGSSGVRIASGVLA